MQTTVYSWPSAASSSSYSNCVSSTHPGPFEMVKVPSGPTIKDLCHLTPGIWRLRLASNSLLASLTASEICTLMADLPLEPPEF